MSRTTCVIALVLLVAMPAAAQQSTPSTAIAQQELDNLTQAQTTLHSAEQAGADRYAKSLYDEAMFNIQFAQQNWSASKKSSQDEARIRAIEGLWAARAALAKANLSLNDIDLVEVNEAFAAQYLAVEQELGLDRSRTNVNGGAIALGHPLGATGTRLVLTLLHELHRRNGRYGLATACIGGGQGIAMIVERV